MGVGGFVAEATRHVASLVEAWEWQGAGEQSCFPSIPFAPEVGGWGRSLKMERSGGLSL